jgi:hypothetical protein
VLSCIFSVVQTHDYLVDQKFLIFKIEENSINVLENTVH